MRKRLSQFVLEQRHTGTVEIRDTESPLVFRVQGGTGKFTVRARIKGQQQPSRFTWPKAADAENLADARLWAQEIVGDCKAGVDPRLKGKAEEARAKEVEIRAARERFDKVVERYVDRRLRKEKNNRTADESERIFSMYVTPRWKGRSIHEISRSDVNALLDDVADGKISGTDGKLYGTPAMADQVLAQLRACFGWYQVQDDKFISPVVKGMRKTNPRRTARDRVLSDSEIRALWRVLPNHGLYGKLVQTLLLTAQRRDEVASMTRSEIDADGIWTIPAERYKTERANVVPLPKHVQTILEDIDQIDECDFYFTTNGKTSFSGFSKAKALLDEAVLTEMKKEAKKRDEDPKNVTLPYWRLHDLRRTARTLMARAGVRPDICERVLGHVIAGVEGVYDRHDYIEQKQRALTSLDAMIDKITNPPPANVVSIREAEGADAS